MVQASREIPSIPNLNYAFKSSDIGEKIYQLVSQLYPICRSITGNGVRETLKLTQEHVPLKMEEIPTGTEVGSLLWVLNLSDGEYSLLDIAERSQLSFDVIKKAADALLNCGLLKVSHSPSL
jgi:aminopeptidase-like protein